MAKDTAPKAPATQAQIREDRLKAALKSNMGRRKAQARARSAEQARDANEAVDSNEGKGPAQEGEQ